MTQGNVDSISANIQDSCCLLTIDLGLLHAQAKNIERLGDLQLAEG